jgi:hydroxycarboxylate dehydrogenase B
MLTIEAEALRRVTQTIFEAAGTPGEAAEQVAQILVESNLAGHDSHGVMQLPLYVQRIKNGQINPRGRPEIRQESAASALVSGNWTFGQVAAAYGTQVAIEKARRERVAMVAVVECDHIGRLGEYTERAARTNLIGLVTAGRGYPEGRVAPFGGGGPGPLGTNPFSFAFPGGRQPRVLVDFATSVIAANKIHVARAKGEQLPPGCIIDREGRPSTDPQDYVEGGSLLPFGSHKGYGLAVVAELLSNVVTGSDAHPGPGRPGGAFILVMDPAAFRPLGDYQAASDRLADQLKAVPPAAGFDGVLLPGEPETRTREQRQREGVPVPEATWQAIVETGAGLGVEVGGLIDPR